MSLVGDIILAEVAPSVAKTEIRGLYMGTAFGLFVSMDVEKLVERFLWLL